MSNMKERDKFMVLTVLAGVVSYITESREDCSSDQPLVLKLADLVKMYLARLAAILDFKVSIDYPWKSSSSHIKYITAHGCKTKHTSCTVIHTYLNAT